MHLVQWSQNALHWLKALVQSLPRANTLPKNAISACSKLPGDTASDELDSAEDSSVQSRLTCALLKKIMLSRLSSVSLLNLVWQLLPQQPHATQTVPHSPADAGNPSPVLPLALRSSHQALSEGATFSLPPPSWSQLREAVPGESSGDHHGQCN